MHSRPPGIHPSPSAPLYTLLIRREKYRYRLCPPPGILTVTPTLASDRPLIARSRRFMTDPTAISTSARSDAMSGRASSRHPAILQTAVHRGISASGTMTGAQRFLRACLRQPVDVTPVWFLRQAGRYMAEYQAVRRHHSLLEICRTPQLAAEVTITAAEKLDVDAAIIFADLLLPFTPMGLDFEFVNGEGPVVHKPVRTPSDIDRSVPIGPRS